jgi:nitrous oxidase accessory protein NosD
LWPRIVLVSKDGYAQFRTIGEAIRNAEPGTRIVIRPGTYAENLILDRKVLLVGDGSVE